MVFWIFTVIIYERKNPHVIPKMIYNCELSKNNFLWIWILENYLLGFVILLNRLLIISYHDILIYLFYLVILIFHIRWYISWMKCDICTRTPWFILNIKKHLDETLSKNGLINVNQFSNSSWSFYLNLNLILWRFILKINDFYYLLINNV